MDRRIGGREEYVMLRTVRFSAGGLSVVCPEPSWVRTCPRELVISCRLVENIESKAAEKRICLRRENACWGTRPKERPGGKGSCGSCTYPLDLTRIPFDTLRVLVGNLDLVDQNGIAHAQDDRSLGLLGRGDPDCDVPVCDVPSQAGSPWMRKALQACSDAYARSAVT